MFFEITICILLFIVSVKVYLKLSVGWCKSYKCLIGKTVIITGANTGIGFETALNLAMRGAKVILACRNKERGEKAKNNIISESGNADIILKHLDLTSFESVHQFASEIRSTEQQLDILINNAGVSFLPDTITQDGYLELIQTNFLSPALLTMLLIDLLKATPNSRIVNVASMAAQYAKLDPNNPEKSSQGSGIIYCNTKLCNILYTIELAKRLKNSSVTTYAVHPGVINTELFRNMSKYIRVPFTTMVKYFCKNPLEGAQTSIYCSVQKDIEDLSGHLFADCGKISYYSTVNMEDAEVLWEKTMGLLKLTTPQRF